MDSSLGIDDRFDTDETPDRDGTVSEATLDVGGDERRMHVRAYNHWVSLLRGRAYPSIEELEPASIADFGPHSVLLDFTESVEDPRIQFLGKALREECGIDAGIGRIAEVPGRSLLSRLTDHYLQIIANQAPIGFEAEFVGTRGHNTLYRGILMPFSSDAGSDGDTIDFIYGVINWKEMVDADTQAKLTADLAAAHRAAPAAPAATPVWADGPSSGVAGEAGALPGDEPLPADAALADRLTAAREWAVAATSTETRSRAALYRALARAYEFARAADDDPEGYAALLGEAGIKAQARAPMTPIVKLVFGADYDKTRLTEFATVLTHAGRCQVEPAALVAFLESFRGGIKGVVAAERAARRPAEKAGGWDAIAAELRRRPPLARIELGEVDGEFVVLLARKAADGALDVVAIDEDRALTDRAARRAAA
ncbi:PAS domain-containing protein [Sphingomonas sp. DT-204]|uniref:PAS domain-containing protein n=1 Tax=Sphingomonas sp. DT-204 TaxID=3396166 RepID=UPI003F1C720A